MMQSETADFIPGAVPPPGKRVETLTYAWHVIIDSGPCTSLCENKMSSTKPEVRSAMHCHRRIEPRSRV